MAAALSYHQAEVAISAPQIRVAPVVELDGRTRFGDPHRVRPGEGLGEPMQLKGHFRVPSQHVPEPLVREPDLVSVLIGEAPHASL